VNPEQEPNRNDSECPHGWKARGIKPKDILDKAVGWLKDQTALFEAFWVAVSFHVLLLPLIWIMGWALPWPKPPVFTTVIEYDLTNWPKVAKPKKVTDYVDPDKR